MSQVKVGIGAPDSRIYRPGAGGGGGGSSNSFETISTSSGTSPVADSATDTLTLTGTAPIVVTGDSATDTIVISTTSASVPAPTTIYDHLESSDGSTWSRVQSLTMGSGTSITGVASLSLIATTTLTITSVTAMSITAGTVCSLGSAETRVTGANILSFRAAAQYIYSSAANTLDLNAGTSLNLRIGGVIEVAFLDNGAAVPGDYTIVSASGGLTLDAVTTVTLANSGFAVVVVDDDTVTIGSGVAAVDYKLAFNGNTTDGLITWKEADDRFLFSDDILMNSTERIYFNDTTQSIYGSATVLSIEADAEVEILFSGTQAGEYFNFTKQGVGLDYASRLTFRGYDESASSFADVGYIQAVSANSGADIDMKYNSGVSHTMTVAGLNEIIVRANTFKFYQNNVDDPYFDFSSSGNLSLYVSSTQVFQAASTSLLFPTTNQCRFRDSNQYISSGAAGKLTVASAAASGQLIVLLASTGSMLWTIGVTNTMTLASTALTMTGAAIICAAATTSIPSVRMPAGAAPSSPTEGDLWNDSTQKCPINFVDGMTVYGGGIIYSQVTNKAVANTVTETTLLDTTNATGTLTLPANWWTRGKVCRIIATGVFSTKSGTTPTGRMRLFKGSTELATSGTQTIPDMTGTTRLWTCVFYITGLSTAFTSVMTQGMFNWINAAASVGAMNGFEVNNQTGGVSTAVTIGSASEALDLKWTWGTADALDTITCTNVIIEAIA